MARRASLSADPRSGPIFLDKSLGGLVLQPDLARTLEEIASEGAETFFAPRCTIDAQPGGRYEMLSNEGTP